MSDLPDNQFDNQLHTNLDSTNQKKTLPPKSKQRTRPYVVQRIRDCAVLPEYKENIGHMMRYLYHTRGTESRYDYTVASKSSADYKATRCFYCHDPYVQPIQHTSCKLVMCYDCAKINAFQCIQCCKGNLCFTEEYFMKNGGKNATEWDFKYPSKQLIEQKLNGLEIHCQNKLYFNCQWIGTRGDYEKEHVCCAADSSAATSTCVQCKQDVAAQEKRLHYQRCRAERMHCLYCGKQGNKRWVVRHQSNCSKCFQIANCLMKPEIFEAVFSVLRKRLGPVFVTRQEMSAHAHEMQRQQQQIRQLQADALAFINEMKKQTQNSNNKPQKRHFSAFSGTSDRITVEEIPASPSKKVKF